MRLVVNRPVSSRDYSLSFSICQQKINLQHDIRRECDGRLEARFTWHILGELTVSSFDLFATFSGSHFIKPSNVAGVSSNAASFGCRIFLLRLDD